MRSAPARSPWLSCVRRGAAVYARMATAGRIAGACRPAAPRWPLHGSCRQHSTTLRHRSVAGRAKTRSAQGGRQGGEASSHRRLAAKSKGRRKLLAEQARPCLLCAVPSRRQANSHRRRNAPPGGRSRKRRSGQPQWGASERFAQKRVESSVAWFSYDVGIRMEETKSPERNHPLRGRYRSHDSYCNATQIRQRVLSFHAGGSRPPRLTGFTDQYALESGLVRKRAVNT